MNWIRAEGVSLVVDLAGTGSDPPPSSERSMLIAEMKTREVDKPEEVLASPTTALVLVRALLPPGVQEGDPLDIEVHVPKRSEARSLQGGWLMKSRLKEFAVLNQRLASGHVTALGQGEILVDLSKRDDKWAVIAVTDHGCGMTPDQVERAAEPFYTTKSETQGNGLGLSMVYGFTKQIGGDIEIESEVDVGTSIRMVIPLAHLADSRVTEIKFGAA